MYLVYTRDTELTKSENDPPPSSTSIYRLNALNKCLHIYYYEVANIKCHFKIVNTISVIKLKFRQFSLCYCSVGLLRYDAGHIRHIWLRHNWLEKPFPKIYTGMSWILSDSLKVFGAVVHPITSI